MNQDFNTSYFEELFEASLGKKLTGPCLKIWAYVGEQDDHGQSTAQSKNARPYLKNKLKQKWLGGVAQVKEHYCRKH
jgi:hypothetical protein